MLRSRACPTPRPQRCDAICAGHVRHVRVRLLTACSFADGLRVSPPVQAAVAACGRAQWPPRPRHLRHDRQARRQHHGHEDPAAVTPRLFRLAQAARCLLAGRGRPGRLSTCLPQTSLCSSTLHTPHTHSLHRPPLTVRFHSNAMPQLTRFSCLRAALARQDLLANHPGRRDPWFVLPAS